ncbi:hypothetical protein [Gemmatimonas sp.]
MIRCYLCPGLADGEALATVRPMHDSRAVVIMEAATYDALAATLAAVEAERVAAINEMAKARNIAEKNQGDAELLRLWLDCDVEKGGSGLLLRVHTRARTAERERDEARQQLAAVQRAATTGQPIATLDYWITAYSTPTNGPHFQGHGKVVEIMREYRDLRSALAPQREEL